MLTCFIRFIAPCDRKGRIMPLMLINIDRTLKTVGHESARFVSWRVIKGDRVAY